MKQYTGLSILSKRDGKPVGLTGRFWVPENRHLGEWEIQIITLSGYPYTFPVLREISGFIPVCPDRHMDAGHIACTENTFKANLRARQGISLLQFIEAFVVRYFKWQLLYECEAHRPFLKSWGHGDDGLREFIYETLESTDIFFIQKVLKKLADKVKIGRNMPCICGSQIKFKKCHIYNMNLLRQAIPQSDLPNAINLFAATEN